MPTTFPVAEKVQVKITPTYELKDDTGASQGIFHKLTPKQAATRPNAVRARLGKRVTWFERIAAPEGDGFVSTKPVDAVVES